MLSDQRDVTYKVRKKMEAPGRFSAKRAEQARKSGCQRTVPNDRYDHPINLLGAEPGLLTIEGMAFIKPDATVTTKKPSQKEGIQQLKSVGRDTM